MKKPKYSTNQNVHVIAITILSSLYLKNIEFTREFNQIVGVYHQAISYWTMGWINSHKIVMLSDEYQKVYVRLKRSLNRDITTEDIDSCLLALDELAWKWNLRLPKPLAGVMWFIMACSEEQKELGVSTVEVGPLFHPHSLAKPLRLTIYDWSFTELGRPLGRNDDCVRK